ncbi:hypothetical protein IWQ57_006025, partial [Coemansia nantahalensis]
HGVVAANCITGKNGKPVTDKLTIALYGATVSQVVTVARIVVHPSYNPATLANNIAVVVFSITGSTAPISVIPPGTSKWDDSCLVRRTLADPQRPKWNGPHLTRFQNNASDLCKVASPIYAANVGDYLCNNAVINP